MTAAQDNQVVIGTATQSVSFGSVGANQALMTDANGNIVGDGGALSNRLSGFDDDIDDNTAGVALALALDSPSVAPGQNFAMSGGVGTFGGEGAIALSFTARVNQNVQLNAGIGSGFRSNTVGGRAGFVIGW